MTYVYLAVFIIIVFMFIFEYNALIAKKNRNDNAFSQVDVYLTKRHDLIPNLVATVGQYAKHERETLDKIAELRGRAASGGLPPDQKAEVETQLSKALGGLMAVVENYPDLKANQQFLQLQASLNDVEEQIAAARRTFNAAVTDYNNSLQMFPTRLMGILLGLDPRPVLAATAEERRNPDVAQEFRA